MGKLGTMTELVPQPFFPVNIILFVYAQHNILHQYPSISILQLLCIGNMENSVVLRLFYVKRTNYLLISISIEFVIQNRILCVRYTNKLLLKLRLYTCLLIVRKLRKGTLCYNTRNYVLNLFTCLVWHLNSKED